LDSVAASAGVQTSQRDQSVWRVRLVLHEALPRGEKQEPGEPSVIMGLRRTGEVWATVGNYNR
jgi:hypothetical protein